jgi:predicted RNA binding protein YcfA (HicA-like mRNA interferase family)
MVGMVGMNWTMSRADLIRELKKAGWTEVRCVGSHHIFKYPNRLGHLTVPHPKKDLGKGLVRQIRKQAEAHPKTQHMHTR